MYSLGTILLGYFGTDVWCLQALKLGSTDISYQEKLLLATEMLTKQPQSILEKEKLLFRRQSNKKTAKVRTYV